MGNVKKVVGQTFYAWTHRDQRLTYIINLMDEINIESFIDYDANNYCTECKL